MTNQKHSTDTDVRRQLLMAFPELDLQHNPVVVVASLVEGVAYPILREKDRSYAVAAGEVVGAIRKLVGLDYEKVEINAAFDYLVERGHASFFPERRDVIVFTDRRVAHLRSVLNDRLGSEQLVREEWCADVRARHSLDRGVAEELWACLGVLITAMVEAHAAESAAFLYLSGDMDQVRFYDALNAKLPLVDEVVPEPLRLIARGEFASFFRHAGQQRTQYLALRLRGAFFYHLLTIDPKASELVRDSVSGKTLYLDTNVLYRLLGLQGPALAFLPATALEVARALGCRLVVTGETVTEFLQSLRFESARVRAIPVERSTYQQLVAEHPTDEWAFMYAFYRELSRGKVKNLDEFERKYSNVEKYLSKWDVEIRDATRLTDELRADEVFKDRLSQLNQWHNSEKGLAGLEHDVFMLSTVRRERGGADHTAGKIQSWFLTFDRKLTRFAVHHAKAGSLPECMLADSWLQIARPFLARTDDAERSLAAVLQHPLMYHNEQAVPFEHMVQAIHRLERYEEIPTPVLAGMLADGEFVRNFREAPTEKEEREILELKLAQVVRDADARSAVVEEELERARQRAGTLENTLVSERRDRERAEEAARATRLSAGSEVASLRTSHEEQVAALRADFSEGIASLRHESKLRARWSWYVFAITVLLLASAVGIVVRGSAISGLEMALWVGWVAVAAILLLGIPLRDRWGVVASVASIVGMLMSLGGLTYQLLQARREPDPHPPATAPGDGRPPELSSEPLESRRGGPAVLDSRPPLGG